MPDQRLPRTALTGWSTEVAPGLLGATLVSTVGGALVAVRLTEVEAYMGEQDPGSHAFRGRTPRTAVMFGPAGYLYVYFTYGMHWCANIVCGPQGTASAVLVRAGEVVQGLDAARARRPAARRDTDLARGPARLASALGIDGELDGADLCASSSMLWLEAPQVCAVDVRTGPRVGVSGSGGSGETFPWRFWLDGDPTVSAYRPGQPRRRRGHGDDKVAGSRRVGRAAPHRSPEGRTVTVSDTRTDALEELRWRGLLAISTDEAALASALASGPVTYYCGFDPTAPSLHIGNLLQLLTMRRLQDAGHRPLALVGGATGLIGDPRMSGERVLNDRHTVAGWVERIRAQVERYLVFDGPAGATVVNNLDWTAPLSAIDFLRDVGKHFRVSRMLAKEAVSARLESDAGISFTEFSYQILQGMDFLELYRRHGCVLQTGGSDQWGNLTAGTDLIHRVEGVSAHALATPLVTKADGTKFGKTETGTVWLDGAMTSPYAFYQFWLNAEDAMVGQYLRYFTFRSREAIEELERATLERPAAREAQRALAADVTDLVHGEDARRRVEDASRALFGRGDLAALDADVLRDAVAELPVARLPRADHSVMDLLTATGLVGSRSAARRTITEGGAYVNNVKVEDEEAVAGPGDTLHGRWLLVRRGRRSLGAVELAETADGNAS